MLPWSSSTMKALLVAVIFGTALSFKLSSRHPVYSHALFSENYGDRVSRPVGRNGQMIRRQPAPRNEDDRSPPAEVEQRSPYGKDLSEEPQFDDAMKAHMNYVAGKLTDRMKTRSPLSKDDLGNFLMSCDFIICDAESRLKNSLERSPSPRLDTVAVDVFPPVIKRETLAEAETIATSNVESRRDGRDVVHKSPTQKKLTSKESDFMIYEAGDGPRSEEIPDPDSPFAELHGLSNTWQIEGMDNMTTEEYYSAINKRILDMKKKRKVTDRSSNTMVNDYFESLSKPRKAT